MGKFLPVPELAAAAPSIRRFARSRKPDSDGPTCIDLFSGAGGMAEGFRDAGFRILSGSDIDEPASRTFRRNFREASFFLGSVESLSGSELLRDAGIESGDLDCLIGGPPCQAFSYNNHQRSAATVRAGLFRHYLRIVAELRPKCLVMENVPGILTIGDGAVLREITESLLKLGYESQARILYAEDFGVPQERRRVFIVATRLGWEDSLFPHGMYGPARKPSERANKFVHRWKREPGVRYGRLSDVSVWNAIGDLPPLENGGGEPVMRYRRKPRTAMQRRLRGKKWRRLFNHQSPNLSDTMLERLEWVPEGGSWRDIPHKMLPKGMQRARRTCHTKRYGRLARRRRCCTILTKADPHWGSYVHPLDHRALSVREAARLQSFPDNFRFLGDKSHQYTQVGNAVPPFMAAAVGSAVRDHIAAKSRNSAGEGDANANRDGDLHAVTVRAYAATA